MDLRFIFDFPLAVPFPDPDWLGNVRDTVDSSVNQVKQGYDEFKNDFNDGFNKIRGTTWSENSENEVESTFKNIRVDADKASDLFWGGRCVLDSNCAYFTIFNYTFQVSKCSSSTGNSNNCETQRITDS